MKVKLGTALMATILMLLAGGAKASAQHGGIKTSAIVNGYCHSLIIHGEEKPCAPVRGHDYSGAFYFVFTNGRAGVAVGLTDGSLMGFYGEKDSQPTPEKYYLYLSHVRLGTRGGNFTSSVGGECVVNMSTDGHYWHSINCDSRGSDGSEYALSFQGNGEPVSVNQSQ